MALQLDPLSSLCRESIGYVYLLQQDFERAEREYRELVDFDPLFYKGWSSLGRSVFFQGRYEEALQYLLKARSLCADLPNIMGALGQTYAMTGNPGRARELLAEMDALAETRFIPQMARAVIYLGLADHESALACLEAACRQRELPLASTGVHPLWNPLRGYPRFKELLGRIGLDVLA